MKRLSLRLLICVAVVSLFTLINQNQALAQSGWQFQEHQGGWYVLAEPGRLGRNDGWWYKWNGRNYYRVYQFGNSYAVTNHQQDTSVVDKLANGLVDLSKQKVKVEQLLLLNQAEQEKLKALAEGLGYEVAGGGFSYQNNGQYGRKGQFNQRGTTIYGYFPSFKVAKDPFEDLKIGAELNRIADAAKEQRESGNETTQNLIKAFNNAVDKYVDAKALENGIPPGQSQGHNHTSQPKNDGNSGSAETVPLFGIKASESIDFRVKRAIDTVSQRCVRCHNGTSTSKDKKLNLSDFKNLDASWLDSILDRITTTDLELKMPQGGPYLNQELIGDFQLLSGLSKQIGKKTK